MVKSRAGWFLGLFAGAIGCAVPNPLFITPDEDTFAASGDTTTTPGSGTDTVATTDPAMTSSSGPGTSGPTTDPAMVCGDGVVDPGESCDDGNATPGDGCESNCKPLFPKDPALIPETPGALAIAIADVNNDGNNDVILAFPGLPSIKRYINKGGAVFAFDGQDLLTPTPVDHLVAAELGGQPGADVAFVSGDFAYVFLESGIGLPAFQLKGAPGSLVAAEIEGGGAADLLIVDDLNGHLNYAIATNNGFGPQVSVSEVSFPRRAAVADVDGNGVSDFLFTSEGGNGVGLFLDLDHDGGPGPALFTEATTASALALGDFALEPGKGPNAVFFGQLQTGGSLQVYVNKGAGVFEKFKNNVYAKDDVMELIAPRLNSPTDDSIVALSPLSFQVFTLVGGEFQNGVTWSINEELRDLAAGDLNGDGRTDLAVVGKNQCYILLNQSP